MSHQITHESVSADPIEVEAKGRVVEVEFPLEIRIQSRTDDQDGYVRCMTANELEVWYFHDDEYELYGARIADFVASSITNPQEMAENEAVHIVSHYINKEERPGTNE